MSLYIIYMRCLSFDFYRLENWNWVGAMLYTEIHVYIFFKIVKIVNVSVTPISVTSFRNTNVNKPRDIWCRVLCYTSETS